MISQTSPYSVFKVTLQTAQNTPIYLNEIQFLVCNRPVPTTFSYPEASYTLYRGFQSVSIAPTTYGFTSCTSNPPLPAGMNLDATTCAITGALLWLLLRPPTRSRLLVSILLRVRLVSL